MEKVIRFFNSKLLLVFFVIGSSISTPASAYPDGPINFVVAFTPGSANDMLVRMISPGLSEKLGVPIVVDNKPGAGGSLGTTFVAQSKPDGQTLGLGSTATLTINPALFKRTIRYDPTKNFEGVAYLASTPNILVVPSASNVKNVDDLVKAMGERQLNYSSPGNGTTQHLTGVMFENQVGKKAQHVPFKGPAEAISALVANHVDFGFASLASAVPQINAGRLRALAVTANKPLSLYPNVPSISSSGFKGFEDTAVWFGIVVPSGTPSKVISKLHDKTMEVLKSPEVQKKLSDAGYFPGQPMSASEFQSLINRQTAFWAHLVETSGASVD